MCFSAHMLLLKFCFVPLVKKVLKSQSPPVGSDEQTDAGTGKQQHTRLQLLYKTKQQQLPGIIYEKDLIFNSYNVVELKVFRIVRRSYPNRITS